MDAAQALILETGFAAAGIEAILERTGVTKGAFFYHFKSKSDLARALIERYATKDAAVLDKHLQHAETLSRDPLQQILTCFRLFEEDMIAMNAPYPGCLYASFIYEAQLFDEEIIALVRRVFAAWRARIAAKLTEVVALYPPHRPVDIHTLADMALAIAEGAYIVSKVNRDAKAVAAQFRHYCTYLDLLFARTAPAANASAV
jgi:TetR/AcrR family transcriptional repressor of nem operon